MTEIYKNIEEHTSNKKRKILSVFDDMIADILSNKKLNLIVTESFIRVRNLSICLVFIMEFCCTKNMRINSAHIF